jgi:hypothetical protein
MRGAIWARILYQVLNGRWALHQLATPGALETRPEAIDAPRFLEKRATPDTNGDTNNTGV